MSFTSIGILGFLPLIFIIYWAMPQRFRWAVILLASLWFYMSWGAKYAVWLAISTVVTWVASLYLEKAEKTRLEALACGAGTVAAVDGAEAVAVVGTADGARIADETAAAKAVRTKKLVLLAACLISFGILFVFKYFNWFFACLDTAFSAVGIPFHAVTLKLIMPVGISFYTFQTMGYVIDVYRGKIPAEKHFGYYAAFVTFFPQILSGPIGRADKLLPQIKASKCFDYDKAIIGCKLMVWGYFKKLIIADFAAQHVDRIYGDLAGNTGFALALVIFLFTIQIYCDFSGYSDIAVGASKLLNIDLMTNFRAPYFSASVREFWSRWHISLSTWFRDYVYISLGGNRCSKARRSFNLMATMLISGLWHGANTTFIVWGFIHGLAQLIEDLLAKPLGWMRERAVGRAFLTLVVFAFCNFAWVFFRADTFGDAFFVITHFMDGIGSPVSYIMEPLDDIGKLDFMMFFGFLVILTIYDFWCYRGGRFLSDIQTGTVINSAGKGTVIADAMGAAVSGTCAEGNTTDKKVGLLHKILVWLLYVILGLIVVFFSQKGVAADFVYFQF